MLISFSVSNYRSIKNKATLSFIGNGTNDNTQYPGYFERGKERVLKGIGIFGANASGKTNVLKGLEALVHTVTHTANITPEKELSWIVPFAFSKTSVNEPTSFEIVFEDKGIRYRYGLKATKKKIVEESLYFSPKGRNILLFERKRTDEIHFHNAYINENDARLIKERNLPNKPIVTFGAQFNMPVLSNVFVFLANKIFFTSGVNDAFEPGIGSAITNHPDYRKFLVSLLRAADLSIDDIDVERERMRLPIPKKFDPNSPGNTEFELAEQEVSHLKTKHVSSGETYFLGAEDESLGTKKVMAHSGPLFDALNNGVVLVFDEFGSSLHPDVSKFLLSLFFNPETNSTGAQILFDTQETSLLNEMLLRRDEIYMTEKDSESDSTSLFPLSDFSVRKSENIERGFIGGRYVKAPDIDEGEISL